MHRFLLTILSLWIPALEAAVVLKATSSGKFVAITQDTPNPWVQGDRVCLQQKGAPTTCGSVVKAAAKGAVVRLDSPAESIPPGTQVKRANTELPQEAPASDTSAKPQSDPTLLNLTAGVDVGTNFFIPTFGLHFAFSRHFALATKFNFFSYTASPYSLSSLSTLLAFNYYSHDYFKGFWVQLAGGLNFFKLTGGTPQSPEALQLLGTVGWRFKWPFGLNIGVGVGGQYIADPNFKVVTVNGLGFAPVGEIDLGLCF